MSYTEKGVVEDFIIEELQSLGWKFVPSTELNRTSYDEPLLINKLKNAVTRINDVELSESEINDVINHLRYASTDMTGVKNILNYIKNGVSIVPESTGTLTRIQLIDFENVDANEFIVTRQILYRSGEKPIRPDIVLYVNGIPLVVIECKNPADPKVSWEDAYHQIKRYEKDFPELFKYVQFSIAAAETTKYWANTPWLEDDIKHEWSEDHDILEATIRGLLTKQNLLDIIQNFIFIKEERGRSFRIITRYMQFRTANKIVQRVIDNLEGRTEKNSGLVWHWQGSGKTFTMVFAAYKLQRHPLLENPTIFVVVDRRDLEEQIYGEFAAVGLSIERIHSIKHLIETLTYDDYKGKRGIFITLIQKFRDEEIREFEREVGRKIILERRNIIVLVDEGHRSQYGSLATEMRRVLKNAFFFAFTGTPIAKAGRDTFRTFSYPDEVYLDRYFIEESIRDGFTVPIYYQPRLPEEVRLKKKDLEFFLEQEFEEIPETFRKTVKRSIQRKLDEIKVYLKNEKRIKMIAEDIAQHFRTHVEPRGFKAMVVAVDREACVMYKRALDEFLPPDYSEIVMTFGLEDPPKIQEYLAEMQEKYHKTDPTEIKKEVITKFKEAEYPKILIVTNMLLTGFDAPILQVMYLDKPLKEHRLLQAIARTNRPFKGVKKAGLIIDYVGIFDELERALAIYHTADIRGVAYDANEIKQQFKETITELLQIFDGIERKDDRKTLLATIKRLQEGENIRKFKALYKELRTLYELISPDPFLADYLEEFKWLTTIYYAYYMMVEKKDIEELEKYVKAYFKKTLQFIHKHINIDKIRNDFPILPIDEEYLKKIEELYPDLDDRVTELISVLEAIIVANRNANPLYESLAEKVERIVRQWRERIKTVEETYMELCEVVDAYNRAQREKRTLGLRDEEFYIFTALREHVKKPETELISDTKELVKTLGKKLFKGWTLQRGAVKEVERTVRTFIMQRYRLPIEERDALHKKIMNIVKSMD